MMRLIDAGELYTKLMRDWDTMDSEEFERAVFRRLTNAPTIGGWIPIDERLPKGGQYVLVSFSNATIVDIGRCEKAYGGGAFYPGDVDTSYSTYGLFVNAWMPLPEPYEEEDDDTDC